MVFQKCLLSWLRARLLLLLLLLASLGSPFICEVRRMLASLKSPFMFRRRTYCICAYVSAIPLWPFAFRCSSFAAARVCGSFDELTVCF